MKLITRQTKAEDALQRYKMQYPKSHKEIKEALAELGNNPHPDDVDRIIGNDSWTKMDQCCNECNKIHDVLLEIGESPWYESQTAWICKECAKKVLLHFP